MRTEPGGRNFAPKLRGLSPSMKRSGVHVCITNRLPSGNSKLLLGNFELPIA
jgi:hypothetical protein